MNHGAIVGKQGGSVARDECQTGICGLRQFGRPTAYPVDADVHFGKSDRPGRIGVLGVRSHGQQGPHDLRAGPGDRRDGGDSEPLIYLGPTRVVDPRYHVFHGVRLPSNARRKDVRVVATADRSEGVRTLDAGVLEGLPIETDPFDGQTTEVGAEFAESPSVLVNDGYRMPLPIEFVGQQGADAPAAEDHDVHATTLHALGSYPDVVSTPLLDGDPVSVGEVLEVEATKVAHGGHMVARWGALVVFVRHALPGERVRVRITEVRSRYLRGDVIEVLDAHPRRRAAMCPVAGLCGGCDFQHAPEDFQRSLKFDVLHEALVHQGRLESTRVDDLMSEGLIDLGSDTGWRTRMHYRTMVDAGGETVLALHQHRSDELVDASGCVIADRQGHAEAQAFAAGLTPGSDVFLAVGRDGPVVASHARAAPEVPHRLAIGDTDLTFATTIDGFWQVHPRLVSAVVDTTIQWGRPRAGETWWDLFAGVGPISAALGVAVGERGRVDAVEGSAIAVREGRRALKTMPWVRWHRGDVRRFVRSRTEDRSGPRPAGVVMDPPRAGAGPDVVAALTGLSPRVIVVVSCDPASLARDTDTFRRHGYELARLRAWDAFPQTHHMETIAVFEPGDRIS